MKFEHLVEINDLSNPTMAIITREQLWRGLVLRAEAPKLFVEYIDECTITERNEVTMTRSLRYGDLLITDKVSFVHHTHVHYDVPAQKDIARSSLRMSIEEPSPSALFVRFEYDNGQTSHANSEDEMYEAYRHAAYKEADIDTIRIIRELADAGRLDSLPS